MAWNPDPKVADCRDIARKWGKQQVIIIAVDTEAGTLEYASYGETKELCRQAMRFADKAFEAVAEKATTEVKEAEQWIRTRKGAMDPSSALPQ